MSTRLPSIDFLDEPLKDLENAPRFDDLAFHHPFVFRFWSNQSQSPLTDGGFISTSHLPSHVTSPSDPTSFHLSTQDIVDMVNWKQVPCKVVSASFSLTYTLFEAIRRLEENNEADVRISIIDSRKLVGHAVTALEALNIASPSTHWHDTEEGNKTVRLANVQLLVLVKGNIPPDCIEAVVNLGELRSLLPPWFGEPIFRFQKYAWREQRQPQIRLADKKLRYAFDAEVEKRTNLGMLNTPGSSRGLSDIKNNLRCEMGSRIGIGITKLQEDVPDRATLEGYDSFVEKASRLAFEFALFPCSRHEVLEVMSKLTMEDIADEVYTRLKMEAIKDALRAVSNDPRFRKCKLNAKLESAMQTLMAG